MKLTKYEHACLVAEQDGRKLIIDPGIYSDGVGTPMGVTLIIVTHEHPDHLNEDNLRRILDANPGARIVAHESISDKFSGFPFAPVSEGSSMAVGPFHIQFFGGQHAEIHPSIPRIANLGVMINDTLYYPGDSFTNPGRTVNYLALPAHAPWMKFSEAADFLDAVRPKFCFPTHDGFLNDDGHELVDRLFTGFAEKAGARYMRLQIGIPTDI